MEKDVVQKFKDNPSTSTRVVASQVGVSLKNNWLVQRDEKMHPFHVQREQQLFIGYNGL